MGMAASQARYLGLTARKTNVEYEGQQINQARTALSNQSASLWNQMLGLTIPTVPSITDYTKLQYSFSDGIANYTISDIQSIPTTTDEDGNTYNKLVTYYFYEDVYKGVESKNSNPQVQKSSSTTYTTENFTDTIEATDDGEGNLTYTIGGNDVTFTEIAQDEDAYNDYLKANNLSADDMTGKTLYSYETTDVSGNPVTKYTTEKPTAAGTSDIASQSIKSNTAVRYMLGNSVAELYDPTDPKQKSEVDQLRYDFDGLKDVPDNEIYKYVKNGQTYFTTKDNMEECIAGTKYEQKEYAISSKIDFQPALTQYYTTTLSEKVENTDYAIMDDASGSGRYSNMKLQNMSTNFNLKAEETTNQAAYNDAMNQYNYDLTRYEKQMSDINAKTSLIQEQDRTLELRLKQLETEQKALTTEMDAVKGVLQKNVESTFGTFK